jgi:hypothetical protein
MTSTMERGKVVGLSDEVIAKMRQHFGDECKQLLEDMAGHANCTCGRAASPGAEHTELGSPAMRCIFET